MLHHALSCCYHAATNHFGVLTQMYTVSVLSNLLLVGQQMYTDQRKLSVLKSHKKASALCCLGVQQPCAALHAPLLSSFGSTVKTANVKLRVCVQS